MFKFGGGECLKSIAQYDIPAYLGGKKVIIRTDVVPSDIPLLLSLNAMKKNKNETRFKARLCHYFR